MKGFSQFVNRLLGWRYKPSPKDGQCYWAVTNDGFLMVATACSDAVNGWSNMDTWEDFEGEVIAYRRCRAPMFCSKRPVINGHIDNSRYGRGVQT